MKLQFHLGRFGSSRTIVKSRRSLALTTKGHNFRSIASSLEVNYLDIHLRIVDNCSIAFNTCVDCIHSSFLDVFLFASSFTWNSQTTISGFIIVFSPPSLSMICVLFLVSFEADGSHSLFLPLFCLRILSYNKVDHVQKSVGGWTTN